MESTKQVEERPRDKRLKRRGKESNIMLVDRMKMDSPRSCGHSSPSWLKDVDPESRKFLYPPKGLEGKVHLPFLTKFNHNRFHCILLFYHQK